jgi:hypothetical protein
MRHLSEGYQYIFLCRGQGGQQQKAAQDMSTAVLLQAGMNDAC